MEVDIDVDYICKRIRQNANELESMEIITVDDFDNILDVHFKQNNKSSNIDDKPQVKWLNMLLEIVFVKPNVLTKVMVCKNYNDPRSIPIKPCERALIKIYKNKIELAELMNILGINHIPGKYMLLIILVLDDKFNFIRNVKVNTIQEAAIAYLGYIPDIINNHHNDIVNFDHYDREFKYAIFFISRMHPVQEVDYVNNCFKLIYNIPNSTIVDIPQYIIDYNGKELAYIVNYNQMYPDNILFNVSEVNDLELLYMYDTKSIIEHYGLPWVHKTRHQIIQYIIAVNYTGLQEHISMLTPRIENDVINLPIVDFQDDMEDNYFTCNLAMASLFSNTGWTQWDRPRSDTIYKFEKMFVNAYSKYLMTIKYNTLLINSKYDVKTVVTGLTILKLIMEIIQSNNLEGMGNVGYNTIKVKFLFQLLQTLAKSNMMLYIMPMLMEGDISTGVEIWIPTNKIIGELKAKDFELFFLDSYTIYHMDDNIDSYTTLIKNKYCDMDITNMMEHIRNKLIIKYDLDNVSPVDIRRMIKPISFRDTGTINNDDIMAFYNFTSYLNMISISYCNSDDVRTPYEVYVDICENYNMGKGTRLLYS